MNAMDRWMPKVIGVSFAAVGVLLAGLAWLASTDNQGVAAICLCGFSVVFLGASIMVFRLFWPRKGEREIVGPYGSVIMGPEASPADTREARREIEQPWTTRKDWVSGRIAEEGAGKSGTLLGAHVGACLVLWGVLGAFWNELGMFGVWLMLITIVLTAGLWQTVRNHLRARKFGTSWFEFRDLPFWMGERLHAVVRTGIPLRGRAFVDLDLRLACVSRWTTFDHDTHGSRREETRETALWKHEAKVRAVRSPRGPVFDLPLDVALPVGLPSSSTATVGDRILWRLELHGDEPGIDYEARFEVPVFARAGAVEAPVFARPAAVEEAGPAPGGPVRRDPPREGLPLDDIRTIRNWICFSLGGFGLVVGGAGIFFWSVGVPDAFIPCIIGAVFVGIAALVWWLMGRRRGEREVVGPHGRLTAGPNASPHEVERAQGTGSGPNGHR